MKKRIENNTIQPFCNYEEYRGEGLKLNMILSGEPNATDGLFPRIKQIKNGQCIKSLLTSKKYNKRMMNSIVYGVILIPVPSRSETLPYQSGILVTFWRELFYCSALSWSWTWLGLNGLSNAPLAFWISIFTWGLFTYPLMDISSRRNSPQWGRCKKRPEGLGGGW